MAHALNAEGFTIICMCPGWVQTDMGSRAADEVTPWSIFKGYVAQCCLCVSEMLNCT